MNTPKLPMVVTVGADHVRIDISYPSGNVATYLTVDLHEPAVWERTDTRTDWAHSRLTTAQMLENLRAAQDVYHFFSTMEKAQ